MTINPVFNQISEWKLYNEWKLSFGYPNPKAIFKEMQAIFSQSRTEKQGFWSNHGISFIKGKGSIVEGRGESIDKITLATQIVLESKAISMEKKQLFFQHINQFFYERGEKIKEFVIDISFQEQSQYPLEMKKNCKVPFSLYVTSKYLQNFFEDKSEDEEDDFFIPLPMGVSINDFKDFLVSFKNLEQPSSHIFIGIRMVQITEWLILTSDSTLDAWIKAIDYSSLSINELKEVLNRCHTISEKAAQHIISKAVMGYIASGFKQNLSIAGMFSEWLAERKMIPTPPLILDFSKHPLQNGDLELLAMLFSCVESLNISNTSLATLPLIWQDSLHDLDISNTKIQEIPQGFSNLRNFVAENSTFQIVDGLDGLTNLRLVNLQGSSTVRAPIGCTNLEEFYVYRDKEDLASYDISGLDGLEKLRIINFDGIPLPRAPIGCTNLEEFKMYAREGDLASYDISGLDGLKKLKIIHFYDVPATRAPIGCTNLEEFYVNQGEVNLAFYDISGLDGLEKLRIIDFDSVPATRAPNGCTNLEQYLFCYSYRNHDISGLDGLLKLRCVNFVDTQVARAPFGCTNLEEYSSGYSDAEQDISGLDGLLKLKYVSYFTDNITRAPIGCLNLETFDASGCENFSDISGLDGLLKLRVVKCARTHITRAPIGCLNLEEFDASGCFNFVVPMDLVN